MAQQLVNEIYKLKGLGKAPKVRITINPKDDGTHEVHWNIPMDQLPALDAEVRIRAAATLRLSMASEANKYLWASDRQKCDHSFKMGRWDVRAARGTLRLLQKI